MYKTKEKQLCKRFVNTGLLTAIIFLTDAIIVFFPPIQNNHNNILTTIIVGIFLMAVISGLLTFIFCYNWANYCKKYQSKN